jgi:peroxiredoxin/mono/diheme cytochrome c family protein
MCVQLTRILLSSLTLLVLLARSGYADEAISTARLGKVIANFKVQDVEGKAFALHDLKDRKAVVVVFLSFECPVSTSYAQPLTKLVQTYREQGVAFIGITADDLDTKALAKQAKEYALGFPVYRDARSAAEALKADVTPEAFVLDRDFVLRYRGRIDDQYAARLKKNAEVRSHDLRQALDDMLAGKPVHEAATKAVGCPLPSRRPKPAATGKVTYHRDVEPIVQKHCQGCHRPNEVGPFSLMTYRQAVNWADDIKEYTQSRKMPPWKATSDFTFHGDRRMSEAEIATLAAWVDGGTPAGDPKDAPSPRRFQEGWALGEPDLVLTVPDDFHLGASGRDLYRCFVLKTNLAEDQCVTAVEVRPGNRRIVHHAVLFWDTNGRARKMEEREQERAKAHPGEEDHGPGYQVPLALSFLPGFLPEGGLSGWAPGQFPRKTPEGVGYMLPKGADVVMQIHYHRVGRAEKDRTTVGFYFSKKNKPLRLRDVTVPGQFLFIPAGAERFKVQGTIWIRQDCDIHTLIPHMHLLGKEVRMTMTPPNGQPRTLVEVKDWDFDWQELYFPREPIPVKADTRFDIEGIYDNSARNPRNPFKPPRMIFGGLETTNEMCVGFLSVTSNKPGVIRFDVQPRIQGLKWAPNWGIPGIGF